MKLCKAQGLDGFSVECLMKFKLKLKSDYLIN